MDGCGSYATGHGTTHQSGPQHADPTHPPHLDTLTIAQGGETVVASLTVNKDGATKTLIL
jgi:hypothetical protein